LDDDSDTRAAGTSTSFQFMQRYLPYYCNDELMRNHGELWSWNSRDIHSGVDSGQFLGSALPTIGEYCVILLQMLHHLLLSTN
jgi:hypothetical protein